MKHHAFSTVTTAAVFTFASFVGLAACGAPASTESGSATEGTTSVSSEALNKGCPATPPATGDACAVVDTRCTYGSDARFGCRTSASCTTTGWSTTDPTCTKIAPPCPAKEPDNSVGPTQCPAIDEGLTCTYGSHAHTCATNNGILYIIKNGKPAKEWWGAFELPAGCPKHAPNYGSACTAAQEGASCNYGGCMNDPADPTVAGSWSVCEGGIWQPERHSCIH